MFDRFVGYTGAQRTPENLAFAAATHIGGAFLNSVPHGTPERATVWMAVDALYTAKTMEEIIIDAMQVVIDQAVEQATAVARADEQAAARLVIEGWREENDALRADLCERLEMHEETEEELGDMTATLQDAEAAMGRAFTSFQTQVEELRAERNEFAEELQRTLGEKQELEHVANALAHEQDVLHDIHDANVRYLDNLATTCATLTQAVDDVRGDLNAALTAGNDLLANYRHLVRTVDAVRVHTGNTTATADEAVLGYFHVQAQLASGMRYPMVHSDFEALVEGGVQRPPAILPQDFGAVFAEIDELGAALNGIVGETPVEVDLLSDLRQRIALVRNELEGALQIIAL